MGFVCVSPISELCFFFLFSDQAKWALGNWNRAQIPSESVGFLNAIWFSFKKADQK